MKSLDMLFERLVRTPAARNALMAVEAPGLSWRGVPEHFAPDAPFFIASCTKLFTAALAIQLVKAGKLQLDVPVTRYLPAGTVEGLHVLDGVDYAGALTMRRLLSQTSGLGDYFEDAPPGQPSLAARILAGEDPAWTPGEALKSVRAGIAPRFIPGTQGKAHYADTNFQLAGLVIETLGEDRYATLVADRICRPLGLGRTYVFTPATLSRYGEVAPISAGNRELYLPRAMASFGPDGGIVSTLDDGMAFLNGFFSGALFGQEWIGRMQSWTPIFFPFRYGLGLMRFALHPALTLFKRTPPVIGHAGSSGAMMFFCPERRAFICGTTNQLRSRSLSYRFMLRALTLLD